MNSKMNCKVARANDVSTLRLIIGNIAALMAKSNQRNANVSRNPQCILSSCIVCLRKASSAMFEISQSQWIAFLVSNLF